jgi:hypothetical protein
MRKLARTLLAVALALPLGALPLGAQASRPDDYESCATTSDYALRLADGWSTFTAESGSRIVRIGDGRLTIDGRNVALSPADRARVAEYHRTIQAMVPEVKDIAVEAIGIAFTAIEKVAATFADGDTLQSTMHRLAVKHEAAIDRIVASFEERAFSDAEFERLIEDTVADVVPEVAGLAAGAAMRAAFSGGDTSALEKRVESLEKTIEQEVEQRARSLEKRAEALCGRMHDLDRIEQAWAVMVDGEKLDLITPK